MRLVWADGLPTQKVMHVETKYGCVLNSLYECEMYNARYYIIVHNNFFSDRDNESPYGSHDSTVDICYPIVISCVPMQCFPSHR